MTAEIFLDITKGICSAGGGGQGSVVPCDDAAMKFFSILFLFVHEQNHEILEKQYAESEAKQTNYILREQMTGAEKEELIRKNKNLTTKIHSLEESFGGHARGSQ